MAARKGRPTIEKGTRSKIERRLGKGVGPAKIAKELGVSVASVYTIKRLMEERA